MNSRDTRHGWRVCARLSPLVATVLLLATQCREVSPPHDVSPGHDNRADILSGVSFEVEWIAREEPRVDSDGHDIARDPDLPTLPGTPPGPGTFVICEYPLVSALRPVGDVDGDGIADLLVGRGVIVPGYEGGARVLSGVDGRWLAEHGPRFDQDGHGLSLCGLGDVDADGVSDYAVGGPRNYRDEGGGYISIHSGRTHALLRTLGGNENYLRRHGASIESLGDVDGDGIPDLAVGSPQDMGRGRVWAASGADGHALWTNSDEPGEEFLGCAMHLCEQEGLLVRRTGEVVCLAPRTGRVTGQITIPEPVPTTVIADCLYRSLTCLGDVNGDGRHDIAVSIRLQVGGPTGCSILVMDGRTGDLLRAINATEEESWFGWSIEPVADMDGDGAADLLTPAEDDESAVLLWISSGTGKTLARARPPGVRSTFCSVGDRNGDGIDEVAVTGYGEFENGVVYLLRSAVAEP